MFRPDKLTALPSCRQVLLTSSTSLVECLAITECFGSNRLLVFERAGACVTLPMTFCAVTTPILKVGKPARSVLPHDHVKAYCSWRML
jgi:hypothetical protein